MKSIATYFLKSFFKVYFFKKYGKSQSNNKEALSLLKYCNEFNIHKSFIEFGFEQFQFNCIELTKSNFNGLLLDGNEKTCDIANEIFRKGKYNSKALSHWIDLDSLEPIKKFNSEINNKLGVLSVDIDGNDYFILKELMKFITPEIIIVEYNPSFVERNISVPYKKDFVRHDEHQSGWYHGASFNAFKSLLKKDYYLINNIDGLNLIFLHRSKAINSGYELKKIKYKEGLLRNKWSGKNANQQFEEISHLKYLEL
jgi:hypothetical protein